MKKYILVYEDNTKSINFRFFECESEELIPFNMDMSIWFHEDFRLTRIQKKFLKKFCINFESNETILIEELPETFIRIEG